MGPNHHSISAAWQYFPRVILILAALAVAACGGGGSGSDPDDSGSSAGGGDTGSDDGTVSAGEKVTSLTLTNTSTTAHGDFRITFGQVFPRGVLGPSDTLRATTADGASVPLQVERKATHRDGSLRHAVLSAHVPSSISASETMRLKLVKAQSASPSGASPSLSELLAGNFDAQVRLSLDGKTFTASARELLGNTEPRIWLDGPVAREWLVTGPVPR